jgi:hypothetical protein
MSTLPIESEISIGELISSLYAQFLELYNDADLASVATAAIINEMLLNKNHGS